MGKSHDTIQLSDEERNLLLQAEERTGTPWRQVLRTLLTELLSEDYPWQASQEAAFTRVWDNVHDSVYDDL